MNYALAYKLTVSTCSQMDVRVRLLFFKTYFSKVTMSENNLEPLEEPTHLGLFEQIYLLQNQLSHVYNLYYTEAELCKATNAVNLSLAAQVDYMQSQLVEAEIKIEQLANENKRLNLTLNHLVSRERIYLEPVTDVL